MRLGSFALASLLFLGGCGYVGPIVPPSPEIPNPISDMSVTELGDHLHIAFTAPARTTDNLKIRKLSEVELRIGPEPERQPFTLDAWATGGKSYELPIPPPPDEDDPKQVAVSYDVPVADWTGQAVAVAVRSAVKKEKNYSPWSNVVTLHVIAPLAPPDVSAEATAQGYKLTWSGEGADVKYRVLRQGPSDKAPVDIGTADKAEYVDQTSQWDVPYTYSVIAFKGSAESLASNKLAVNHADIFPPAVPSEVAALAAADSVEVSWLHNTESDLKGYFVYRSANGGDFDRQGGLLDVPSYSDHNVEHEKTYRYAISAIDQKNNESPRSAAVAVTFP